MPLATPARRTQGRAGGGRWSGRSDFGLALPRHASADPAPRRSCNRLLAHYLPLPPRAPPAAPFPSRGPRAPAPPASEGRATRAAASLRRERSVALNKRRKKDLRRRSLSDHHCPARPTYPYPSPRPASRDPKTGWERKEETSKGRPFRDGRPARPGPGTRRGVTTRSTRAHSGPSSRGLEEAWGGG